MIGPDDEIWLRAAARVQAVIDLGRKTPACPWPDEVVVPVTLSNPNHRAKLGRDGPFALRMSPATKIEEVGLYVVDATFNTEDVERWVGKKLWKWRQANWEDSRRELAPAVFEKYVAEALRDLKHERKMRRGAKR